MNIFIVKEKKGKLEKCAQTKKLFNLTQTIKRVWSYIQECVVISKDKKILLKTLF